MLKFALAVLLFSTIAVAQDSAMFRGNPQHTGVYNAAGAPQLHEMKWKFKTGGYVIGSPAVVGDTLYVGSVDHHMYAIDVATGKERWKFKTGARVVSSAAVDAGVVYFGSYDGSYYAVDAASGKEKWKFATGGERRFAAPHLHGMQPVKERQPDAWDFYMSSPVVSAGVVYFGSGDGNVYAVNAADGSLKWKFATGDVVHASPALAEGTIYIGSWDSYFYAIDAASGNLRWKFKTGEDHDVYNQVGIQSSAAVANGMVYFGCRDSHLYALDAKTGEKKWAYDNKGTWIIASPAVRDGKVYVTSSEPGLLFAFEAATGKQIYAVDDKKWVMFSSPALASEMLYVGSLDGSMRAFDVNTGKVTSRFQTELAKQNVSAMSKDDGSTDYMQFFKDDFYDDMMFTVQTLLKRTGSILSSPVVVGDTVYFGSSDGNVYAVR